MVIDAILNERDEQDRQWGGAAHDDKHSSGQWASFRGKFENRQLRLDDDPRQQERELVKLAALCVAQIECIHRKALAEEGAIEQGG